MDEYELLLRHASGWARDRKRNLDAELVGLALDLRGNHDNLPANQWLAGSVEHLMLVRWPSHGPVDPPDVDVLVESLDAFWGFLRSTGRMSAASAQPAQLRREARRAAPRMAVACADQSRFGTAKQLLTYGGEIGIDFDEVADLDEANRRMQQIMDAWNAQPEAERLARSANWPVHGRPLDLDYGSDDRASLDPRFLPVSSLFEFDEDGALLLPQPLDMATSAACVQSSGVVRRMLALAEWVGEGKPVTATRALRPAVGRQAYVELGLGEWERTWLNVEYSGSAERTTARNEAPTWRSATDCFALERLWRPALACGLITSSGRTARFDPSAVPSSPDGWLRLGLIAATMTVAAWENGESFDLAIETLARIDIEHGEPLRPDELADNWWNSPANTWRDSWDDALEDEEPDSVDDQFVRDISDDEVAAWLAVFADHGLWREQGGRLFGTEFARDVLVVLVATLSETDPWAE